MRLQVKKQKGNLNVIIKIRKEEGPIRFLAFLLNWNVITGIIESMARLPGLSFLSGFSNITVVFSILFVGISVLYTIGNSSNWKTYLLIIGWMFLFALSSLLNSGISPMTARGFIYYANNVFCIAVLLQAMLDFNLLVEKLKKYIPITVLYAALQWMVGTGEDIYSMSFSYATMVSMLLCLLLCIREKNNRVLNIIFFIVLLATNFRYGSRGSLVCCALLIVLNLALTTGKKKIKNIVIAMVGILAVGLYWERILLMLQRLFPEARNVVILSQRIMFYGSGREEIYGKVLEEILKSPLAIRGLYSDRVFLSGGSQNLNVLWGSYTHNIFLECLYQWGIWCIPIIVTTAVWMIRLFLMTKGADEATKIILIVVYTFAIGQLMISSSYLIAPSFGLLVGFMLWGRRNRNRFSMIDDVSYGLINEQKGSI